MSNEKTLFEFSESNILLDGGSTKITITPKNSSYSHILRTEYGRIDVIPSGTTSYIWTPTSESLSKFLSEIPNKSTRLIDVYLDTYDSNTKIGTDVHSLCVTLSEETGKPDISSFIISDSNAIAAEKGIILQGLSYLTAEVKYTTKCNATISKTIFVCDYDSEHYEALDINVLISSLPLTIVPSSFIIGCKVVDSRGFSSTTITKTLSIAKYKNPYIDIFDIVRSENGVENPNGSDVNVVVKGGFTPLKVENEYKNELSLVLLVSSKDTTQTKQISITISEISDEGTFKIEENFDPALNQTYHYYFQIKLTDSFGSYCYSDNIIASNSDDNIIMIPPDGSEIEIGPPIKANSIISDSVSTKNSFKYNNHVFTFGAITGMYKTTDLALTSSNKKITLTSTINYSADSIFSVYNGGIRVYKSSKFSKLYLLISANSTAATLNTGYNFALFIHQLTNGTWSNTGIINGAISAPGGSAVLSNCSIVPFIVEQSSQYAYFFLSARNTNGGGTIYNGNSYDYKTYLTIQVIGAE